MQLISSKLLMQKAIYACKQYQFLKNLLVFLTT